MGVWRKQADTSGGGGGAEGLNKEEQELKDVDNGVRKGGWR